MGFAVIHNSTCEPFLTSDNPVSWYDPSIPTVEQPPYGISIDGSVVIQFPISPTLLLLGTKAFRDRYCNEGVVHLEVDDEAWVAAINTQTCRFGYEAIITQSTGFESLIVEHSALSPIFDSSSVVTEHGIALLGRYVFGKRSAKPKWKA